MSPLLAAALLLAAQDPQPWEYRQGVGYVNTATLERKSPEEFVQYALALRKSGDAAGAIQALALIVASAPDPALQESAQFERAVAYFEAGRFRDAYDGFKNFVMRYPQSDRATLAKQMEMKSALEWARKGEKGFLGISSGSSAGIEALRDSLKRYPHEDFSADYVQRLGFFFYKREDWDHAAEQFNHVLEFYGDRPDSVLALYMLGLTSENRFDGVERDVKPLKDARRHYERWLEEADRMRRLPGDAERWVVELYPKVKGRLAGVYERLLEKQLLTAEYYERKGFPRSAQVYYKSILKDDGSFRKVLKDPKDFPETRAARKAHRRLGEIPAELEARALENDPDYRK